MGLKSPSDGRWDGRCRTGFVTSPCTERKKERPHQDVFGIDLAYGDQPLTGGRDHDGQDATIDAGRFPGHVAAMLGLFGTCDMMLEPQEGQRLLIWWLLMP
jgi:hypothetical protein